MRPLTIHAVAALAALAVSMPMRASAYPVKFHVSFAASADVLTDAERENLVSHVLAAGARWTNIIDVPTPRYIEIEIAIADIPTANGASLATAYIGDIDGRAAYEQGVARELRLNEDPNMAEPDGRITIGLDYLRNELWFDPDPAAPPGSTAWCRIRSTAPAAGRRCACQTRNREASAVGRRAWH